MNIRWLNDASFPLAWTGRCGIAPLFRLPYIVYGYKQINSERSIGMSSERSPAKRGRPPSINRQRIAEAGMDLGLADLTFVGVASHMGVSHMALYKHVASLDELKCIVADAIFDQHRLPLPEDDGCGDLESYLRVFSASLWSLAQAHADLAPYLLRLDKITSAMSAKIADHHGRVAGAYGVSLANARWLLFTVAYHSVALADAARTPQDSESAPRPNLDVLRRAGYSDATGGFELGMHGLILGAMRFIDEASGQPEC